MGAIRPEKNEAFPSLLTHSSIPCFLSSPSFLPHAESIIEPAGRPTLYPPTSHAAATTPSTAHVRLKSPHYDTSLSPWDDDQTDGSTASFVDALPPPMVTESALTTNRPVTTPRHPPHSTTPRLLGHTSPGSSPTAFEDSGSGEPSGDDQVAEEEENGEDGSAGVLEASGEEPVGKSKLFHFITHKAALLEVRGQSGRK